MKIRWLALVLLGLSVAPAKAETDLTVAMGSVEDLKSVFATVETVDVISARARIGGTITSLGVDEGAAVRRGQPIAVVGDAKLGLRVKALQARIESMTAQRRLAETTVERARKLKQSGTIAQSRLDEAETALDVVRRDLLALQAERAVVLQQSDEGVVKAPGDGRVIKVHVTRGTVIMAGEAVATIAARGYILRLNLPERHARFIGTGDRVIVGDGRTGRVSQVYPEIRQGRVVADVKVEGLGDYFIGERIRVRVGVGRRDVILVPGEYLFRRFGLAFATLKSGAEIVVQPGLAHGRDLEILSGLRVGDVLVLPGRE